MPMKIWAWSEGFGTRITASAGRAGGGVAGAGSPLGRSAVRASARRSASARPMSPTMVTTAWAATKRARWKATRSGVDGVFLEEVGELGGHDFLHGWAGLAG